MKFNPYPLLEEYLAPRDHDWWVWVHDLETGDIDKMVLSTVNNEWRRYYGNYNGPCYLGGDFIHPGPVVHFYFGWKPSDPLPKDLDFNRSHFAFGATTHAECVREIVESNRFFQEYKTWKVTVSSFEQISGKKVNVVFTVSAVCLSQVFQKASVKAALEYGLVDSCVESAGVIQNN